MARCKRLLTASNQRRKGLLSASRRGQGQGKLAHSAAASRALGAEQGDEYESLCECGQVAGVGLFRESCVDSGSSAWLAASRTEPPQSIISTRDRVL